MRNFPLLPLQAAWAYSGECPEFDICYVGSGLARIFGGGGMGGNFCSWKTMAILNHLSVCVIFFNHSSLLPGHSI